jgi:hypothetical protein
VVTEVFAGIPVDDFETARAWYQIFVGRSPDMVPKDGEAVWKLAGNGWIYVVADDERAVAVYRAQGEREGRTLDIDQALFCEIRDGKIVDVTAVPLDFPAFDAFWA